MPSDDALRRYLRDRHIVTGNLIGISNISDKVLLEAPSVLQADVAVDTEVQIGAYSGIFGGRLRHVRVGRYCSIAREFNSGWDDHPIDRITSSMISYVPNVHGWADVSHVDLDVFARKIVPYQSIKGVTEIGNDVWIGHGVFVASGVKIGSGAVVGARSLVTRDVKPYEIVAGTPAKHVRFRFEDDLVARCLQSKWWEYNIFRYDPDIMAHPMRFLDALERDVEHGLLPDVCSNVVSGSELKQYWRDAHD